VRDFSESGLPVSPQSGIGLSTGETSDKPIDMSHASVIELHLKVKHTTSLLFTLLAASSLAHRNCMHTRLFKNGNKYKNVKLDVVSYTYFAVLT